MFNPKYCAIAPVVYIYHGLYFVAEVTNAIIAFIGLGLYFNLPITQQFIYIQSYFIKITFHV